MGTTEEKTEVEFIGWDEPQPPQKVRLLVTVPTMLPVMGQATRLATREDLLRACKAAGIKLVDDG